MRAPSLRLTLKRASVPAIAQIVLVVAAGRADQQEAAGIVVAVIVEEGRPARVEVGIEALAVIAGAGMGRLVELDQAVVGAPLPDAGIVAGRAAAGVEDDIMFDQGAVRAAGDDAVAADVLQIIVADHHLPAGEPVEEGYPVADPGDAGPIDAPQDVPLDREVLEAGGELPAGGAEQDAAIVLAVVGAADIVDIIVADADAPRHPAVFGAHQYADARGRRGGGVGDFQPTDRDVIGVDHADGIFRNAARIDARARAGAGRADRDGRSRLARAGDRQRFPPDRSGGQQDAVAGPERPAIDPRERAPGPVAGGAVRIVVALAGIDIIGFGVGGGDEGGGKQERRKKKRPIWLRHLSVFHGVAIWP